MVGGLLASKQRSSNGSMRYSYPYLTPNLFSAAVLVVDIMITMVFLEESLEEAKDLPPLGKRVTNLSSWAWQFASSSRPNYLRLKKDGGSSHSYIDGTAEDDDDEDHSDSESASLESIPTLLPDNPRELTCKQSFNRDTGLFRCT